MRTWRWSRSASLAATNSAAVPATICLRKRAIALSNKSASPVSSRASRKAVRTVMSFFDRAISWLTERTEWPTLSLRSQSRWRTASAIRSCSAVGALAVRNIRSRSLFGAISPRPVPPSPTSAMLGVAARRELGRRDRKRAGRAGREGRRWPCAAWRPWPGGSLSRRAISARPAASASARTEDRSPPSSGYGPPARGGR